jgi:hypothetical protein
MAAISGVVRTANQGNVITFTLTATAAPTGDTIDLDFGSAKKVVKLLSNHTQITTAGTSTRVDPELHSSATLGAAGVTQTLRWAYDWGDETPGMTVNAGSPEVYIPTADGHLYYRPKPDGTGSSVTCILSFEAP